MKKTQKKEILQKVREIYSNLNQRPFQRNCTRLTQCCRFQLTGKIPQLTKGEALLAAHALRASGRKKIPVREDGACPLLHENGACLIYEDRPFGCRTHFCSAAGGVYPRAEMIDLIRRLEEIDLHLEGDGPRALPLAIESVLNEEF